MPNYLVEAYTKKQLPHAMLLVGQPSQARHAVDELIAALDLNPADYLLLSESVTLKIADARTIRRFVEKSRFTSPIKLVFIANADQLTPEAANALLKTLEEPAADTHLILASRRPENLLPTVVSRCQQLILRDENESEAEGPIVPPLPEPDLAAAFALAKELAVGETPLPIIFESWLARLYSSPLTPETASRIGCLLGYLSAAQTTVNRRLLLDNFFLDLYNKESGNERLRS